jgi:hypothetical protein
MKKTLITSCSLLFAFCLQAQRISETTKADRNINNHFGYIVKKNGEKIEGHIRIKYFELENPNMVNTDLRTAVSISYEVTTKKGKTKTKGNTFRPKNVEYFVVIDNDGNEQRYEPVSMAVFGNLMSSTSIDLDARKPYFQRVVYANGDYVVYFDPSSMEPSTDYTVVRKKGEKANLFAELLRNGKTTKSFVGSCSSLLEKLDQKQISNDEAGAKEFINDLVNCR